MKTILYVAASQFSGSTLASFLLNAHSDVTTVGHTMGWHFGPDDDFLCSCGEPLDQCRFYLNIADAYALNDLRFDIRDFGTEVRLSLNDRLNRYLTASLPLVQSNRLELLRDLLVSKIHSYASRIEIQLHTNAVFMTAAMEYCDAHVYVDNSHDPYRLRQLGKIESLDLKNIHLVRDPRGVALSCMKHSNWSPELAARLWLRRQADILRISSKMETPSLLVYYEDLCSNVNETLQTIHRFANIDPAPFSGSFDQTEHHILGNDMRLRGGEIRLDERWKTELSSRHIENIGSLILKATDNRRNDRLRSIAEHYIERH